VEEHEKKAKQMMKQGRENEREKKEEARAEETEEVVGNGIKETESC